jgi:hypothetical protein
LRTTVTKLTPVLLAEEGLAVALACCGRLLAQVEGIARCFPRDHLERLAGEHVHPFHHAADVGFTVQAIERREQRLAILETPKIEFRGKLQALDTLLRIDPVRVVRCSQVGGTALVSAGPANTDAGDRDVGRQAATLLLPHPGNDGTDRRIQQRALIGVGGVEVARHEVLDGAAVPRLLVGTGADDGESIRHLGMPVATLACRGRTSQISRPGTFVWMGLQGPRYSSGAPGFGS